MGKRALIVVVAALGVLVAAATLAFHARLVVVVPDAASTLAETRSIISDAGLRSLAVSEYGGAGQALGAEFVLEQRPRAGRFVLRGSTVSLTVGPDDEEVIVPGLRGMFDTDATAELARVGLRASGPSDFAGPVVYSQEPTAGTVVAFGSVVEFAAAFPHSADATTHLGVKAVHGILYARYGIRGADVCSDQCHTANTCAGPGCHSQSAYWYLDAVTPDPH